MSIATAGSSSTREWNERHMTKKKATTREKLLICAISIAFLSLNIVLGSFFSRGSWSPAVVTAAASYLIVFIVVAAAAGIRALYRDWKTPPRHAVGHPAATLPANLAGPAPTPARAQQPRAPGPAHTTRQFRDHRRGHRPRPAIRLRHRQPVHQIYSAESLPRRRGRRNHLPGPLPHR